MLHPYIHIYQKKDLLLTPPSLALKGAGGLGFQINKFSFLPNSLLNYKQIGTTKPKTRISLEVGFLQETRLLSV